MSEESSLYLHFFVLDHFQVIDDKNVRRQIVQTTFRKQMKAMVRLVCFPLRLSDSWERIDLNLAELTNELFGTKYVETAKIQVSVDVTDYCHISILTDCTLNCCSFPSRFMQTVGFEECTSLTDSTLTKSCRGTLK